MTSGGERELLARRGLEARGKVGSIGL